VERVYSSAIRSRLHQYGVRAVGTGDFNGVSFLRIFHRLTLGIREDRCFTLMRLCHNTILHLGEVQMPCACGGGNNDAAAEYDVRLPNGENRVVVGKMAAEQLVAENGGGSIRKRE